MYLDNWVFEFIHALLHLLKATCKSNENYNSRDERTAANQIFKLIRFFLKLIFICLHLY